jgi:hypothetical protein
MECSNYKDDDEISIKQEEQDFTNPIGGVNLDISSMLRGLAGN